MNICIVTHYFTPHIGGVERISFEQAKRLSTLGYHVTVVSSRLDGDLPEEVNSGIKICRVNALNYLYDYFGIPFPLASPALLNVLRQEIRKADICIIYSFGFLSSFTASWLSMRERVPYLLYQLNPRVRYKNQILNLLQRSNELIFGKFVIKHANRVLAVSSYVSEYLTKIVPCDVTVLYPAVDHNKFHPIKSYRLIRKELGLPLDKTIVLTVRRLVSKNSVDVFLAVAALFRDDKEIFFVVVGDGPEYTRLNTQRRTIQENCKFVGEISDELLPKYYQASDLFILPSIAEGFGIVLLEAMSSGKPIILAKNGGQMEALEKGRNGLLVKEQSEYQFAQAIRRFRDAPVLLETMGNCGRETILEKFSWEKHMQLFLKIIQETKRS
jgi:glycosyltransferase involved in cell wall biosynthesis